MGDSRARIAISTNLR